MRNSLTIALICSLYMRIRMDWKRVNFDWNRARAFLVTAEEGSLSAAARALGLVQPTLGRQVTALEEELGVALFERVGRALVLTPSGLDLLEHVRAMGEAAGRVSLAASGQSQLLEGSVTITASEIMAAFVLAPIILTLRERHPGIEIELVASNVAKDLRRREADIAVRSFRPTQPDLVATKVRESPVGIYGNKKYWQRLGRPKADGDLSRVSFVGFDSSDLYAKTLQGLGLQVTRKNFPVLTENHLVQWELIKRGAGLGMVPIEVGEVEPRVERVFPHVTLPVPIWLTAHREVSTSRRVRTVFDLLAAELGRQAESC